MRHIYREVVCSILVLCGLLVCVLPPAAAARLKSKTLEAWDIYISLTEERIASELTSKKGFLVQDFLPDEQTREYWEKISTGEIYVDKLETKREDRKKIDVPSGMIHHWFGSVFVPDVRMDTLLVWLQRYSDHEKYFEEVEVSKLLEREGDVFEIALRLVRKKVITVHYNTEHHVEYTHHDSVRVSSKSYSTMIAQIDNAGKQDETEMTIGDDSGYLWRLNSYWRFEEVEGGVIIECESVSLSRGVPLGFKWLVGRFINSVPRESMENTLRSIRNGIGMQ